MTKKKESSVKDIFKGENIGVWEDDDVVFIDIYPNGITFCQSKEVWEETKEDLDELVNGKKNRKVAV